MTKGIYTIEIEDNDIDISPQLEEAIKKNIKIAENEPEVDAKLLRIEE
jgi:hypothetical protein